MAQKKKKTNITSYNNLITGESTTSKSSTNNSTNTNSKITSRNNLITGTSESVSNKTNTVLPTSKSTTNTSSSKVKSTALNLGKKYLEQLEMGIMPGNYIARKISNKTNEDESWVKNLLTKPEDWDSEHPIKSTAKVAGGTLADIGTDVAEGFLSTVEGVTDTYDYLATYGTKAHNKLVSKALKKAGYDEAAEKVLELNESETPFYSPNWWKSRGDYDTTGTILGKDGNNDLWGKDMHSGIEANSVAGSSLDEVAQGVGNVAAMAGMSYIGGKVTGVGTMPETSTKRKVLEDLTTAANSFTSAYGSTRSEAVRAGYSDDEANKAGLVSGFAEAISEQFFNGIPGLKVAGWGNKVTDKIADSLTKYFGTEFGEIAKTILGEYVGEGLEEIISNIITALGSDILMYFDENYTYGTENLTGNAWEDFIYELTSKESWDSFFSASLTSLISKSVGVVGEHHLNTKIAKQYAKENNISEEEAQKTIKNAIDNANQNIAEGTPTSERIEQKNQNRLDVLQSAINGTLDTGSNSISQSGLDNVNSQIQATQEQYNTLNEELVALRETLDKSTENSVKQETQNRINEVQTKMNELSDKMSSLNASKKNISDALIKQSQNSLPEKTITTTKSTPQQIISNAYDSLNDVGLELTPKTKSIIEVAATRGINLQFVDNLNDANGTWLNNSDGSRTILISKEGINNFGIEHIFDHELVHDMAGTSEGKQLIKDTLQAIKQFEGESKFNEIWDEVKEKYSNEYGNKSESEFNDLIAEEITAEYLAKYLSNQQFVDSLVHTRPSLARRIYNKIVNLIHNISGKGYKTETEYWNRVKENFEIAFYKEYEKSGHDAKYFLVGDNANLTKIQEAKLKTAKELKEKKLKDKYIWAMTGWERSKVDGKWRYEISDAKIKKNVELKENVDYKLVDVLDADKLFKAYPQLKEYEIGVTDLTKYGKNVMGMYKDFGGTDKGILISNKAKSNEINEIINHELQHCIQRFEGFATGGSRQFYYEGSKLLNSPISEEYAYELYKRTGGEVEARNVAKRSTMLPLAKKLTMPSATQDIATKDIVTTEEMNYYLKKNGLSFKQIEQLSDDVEDFTEYKNEYNNVRKELQAKLKQYDKAKTFEQQQAITDDITKLTKQLETIKKNISKTDTSKIVLPGGVELTTSKKYNPNTKYSKTINSINDLDQEYNVEGSSARFSENRLEDIISNSASKWEQNYARSYVTRISPQDFLNLTTDTSMNTEDFFKKLEGTDKYILPLDKDRLRNERQNIYLRVDMQTGQVLGHEGRHRALALQKEGITSMDIEIEADGDTYDRYNAIPEYTNFELKGQKGIKNTKDAVVSSMLAVSQNNLDKVRSEYLNNGNENDIRYSKDIKSINDLDSQGNKLTKQQKEYFEDSKIKTPDGKLRIMYRGGDADFTIFDRSKANPAGGHGSGFYFTTSKDHALEYSSNVKEYYLNITNPLNYSYSNQYGKNESKQISKEQLAKLIDSMWDNEDYSLENYGYGKTTSDIVESLYSKGSDYEMLMDLNTTAAGDMTKFVEYVNDTIGTSYDGILTDYETIAFDSNQIKLTSNTNPTNNKDIRYSKNIKSIDNLDNQDNKYGTSLMNKYYNALTKKQWSKLLNDIKNGIVTPNEFTATGYRYDDKIVYVQTKHGKPQVTEVYEINQFELSKYNITLNDFKNIIDELLSKEGYNEGEIYTISEMFGTQTLLSKYDTKMHSFTVTSGRNGRSNEFIDTSSGKGKNGTSIRKRNSENRAKIYEELENSSFNLQKKSKPIDSINELNQEDRLKELNSELESWYKTRDVTYDERDALRKQLYDLIHSEEYKNNEQQFLEMVKSGISPSEIEKTDVYKLMSKEQNMRNQLKDYDEDIKVMNEDINRISEMIEKEEKSHRNPEDAIKEAKKIFGTTKDFNEAAYLLQDGTMLDFSGRKQGSNTYGKRTLDHREINEIGYDMDEFIELGNVRMKPEAPGFEISKPLTSKQKSTMRDYLDTITDEINVDICKDGKIMYDSITYPKGTTANKIFNDLDYYFENGEFPKQSDYAQFRYSKLINSINDLEANETGTSGTLMAIHNLGEKKLKGIIELGGLPVPSIAVTNPNIVDHSGFGSISLLFNKDTINPELDYRNEVYDRDVWSKTQPKIEYEILDKEINKVANQIGIEKFRLNDYAESVSTPDELIYKLKRNESVINKYIEEKDISYDTVYEEAEPSHLFNKSQPIQKFIKDNDLTVIKLAYDNELKKQYYELIGKYFLEDEKLPKKAREYLYEEKINQLEDFLDSQKGAGDSFVVNRLLGYQKDFDNAKNGYEQVIDEYKTNKNKLAAAEQNGIDEYLLNETNSIFGKKGIYNGKDYLTASGNRRSFWQLHDEYNLENIVRELTKGDTKGTQNWLLGFGQVQAVRGNKYDSINEIKSNEHKITNSDEANESLEDIKTTLYNSVDRLNSYIANDKQFYDYSGGWDIVYEFAKYKNLTEDNFKKVLKNNYVDYVPQDIMEAIIHNLKYLDNIKTDYFEAKPQRAVGLDEIVTAVIPSNTSEEIKQLLKNNNIAYVEYNESVEGDRNRVINTFDNLKFQKTLPKFQSYLEEKYGKDDLSGNPTETVHLPKVEKSKLPTTKQTQTTEFNEVVDKDIYRVDLKQVSNQIGKNKINLDDDYLTEYDLDQQAFELTNGNVLWLETPKTWYEEGKRRSLDEPKFENKIVLTELDQNDNQVQEKTITGDNNTFTRKQILDAIKEMTYDDSNKVAKGQIDMFGNIHTDKLSKKVNLPTTKKIEVQKATEPKEINSNKGKDVVKVSIDELKAQNYPEEVNGNQTTESGKVKAEETKEPEKLANILDSRPVNEKENNIKLAKMTAIKILDKGYYVDKLARQTKNRELSSKYDYMLMANGISQQIIGSQRYNLKTQKSEGKGLFKIFEPIENSGKLKEFSEYMYHKHNISRMTITDMKDIDGNPLYEGEENKPIFGDSVTAKESQKIVDEYEKNNPEFLEWANEVYDYNNYLLQTLVDYGVISSEDKKYYNKKYPYYVPTIRATEKTQVNMQMQGKNAAVNLPIKRAKGGNEDIIPLKEAMSLRTMQTINSALRNNFGNELLDATMAEYDATHTDLDKAIEEEIDVDELLTAPTKTSNATITIYKNGEKLTFEISDEIYEALKSSNRIRIKALNKLNNIRRGLLTEWNITFSITNPIKDIQDGMLNSKHPGRFLGNLAEAAKQIATKGEYYQLYVANGGSYETYFNYGEGYNVLPTARGKYNPMKIIDKVSGLNEAIEMTPRLAEFISSLEAGDSIETAMYNAQEVTTNFKRGGDWTKNLDANGFTFLNAGVQGGVKVIRNVQDAKTQGIRGVMNLVIKTALVGLTPAILGGLLWGDDDDYEELSDYVKNNYYIIWKYGDGKFVRIPKGRVMSVIQNMFQQGIDAIQGKDDIDFKEFIEMVQNQVLPNDPTENNLLSPLIQAFGSENGEAWYGGDIVPTRLQDLPAAEQYDETTDSLSIWLGEKLNISPVKISYVLDQYSGILGDMSLPMLTQDAEYDTDTWYGKLLAPLADKFSTDSTINNKYSSEFYELRDELEKNRNSKYATDTDIVKYKYMYNVGLEISDLYAEKRTIQGDKDLTEKEKYNAVREVQRKIDDRAKTAIKNVETINVTGTSYTVDGYTYYIDNNGDWTKKRS